MTFLNTAKRNLIQEVNKIEEKKTHTFECKVFDLRL